MKVLSLFDGMACGMLAMQAAGITVDRYVAFEIDKYAVQTSSHNFPMIEHRGDVFQADFTEFVGFDFLVGGSPCTYWSIAQKNNRETEASGMGWELFSQYVRALREARPRYFIYENNKSMSKAIRESITETFGFEPICINSALVSAQNRQRLYWVGKLNLDGTYSKVHVDQPEDRGILLRDVLDGCCWLDKSYTIDSNYHKTLGQQGFERQSGRRKMVAEPVAQPFGETNGKAYALTASYWKGQPKDKILEKSQRTHVAEPVGTTKDGKSFAVTAYYSTGQNAPHTLTKHKGSMAAEPVRVGCYPSPDGTLKNSQGMRIYSVDGKSVNMTALGGGLGAKTGLYAISVGNMYEKQGQNGQLFSIDGKSKTLSAGTGVSGRGIGSSNSPKVCIPVEDPCIYQVPHGFNDGGIKYEKTPTLTANGSWPENNKVISAFAVAVEWDETGRPTKAVSGADGKTYPVYEVKGGQITIKDKQFPIKLADGYYIIRKLTVSECKRLQTVPEWYEFPVSDTQAYKMLGNGWTVAVIAHLIIATQADYAEDFEEYQLNLFEMVGV